MPGGSTITGKVIGTQNVDDPRPGLQTIFAADFDGTVPSNLDFFLAGHIFGATTGDSDFFTRFNGLVPAALNNDLLVCIYGFGAISFDMNRFIIVDGQATIMP